MPFLPPNQQCQSADAGRPHVIQGGTKSWTTVHCKSQKQLYCKVNYGKGIVASLSLRVIQSLVFCATVNEETLTVVRGSLPVQVSYGDDLAANVVVESVDAVGWAAGRASGL